jgi:hypothetical protein
MKRKAIIRFWRTYSDEREIGIMIYQTNNNEYHFITSIWFATMSIFYGKA